MSIKLKQRLLWLKSKRIMRERENLQNLARSHGGRVVVDSQFGPGVHVDKFTFVTSTGQTIVEWP